MTMTPTSTKTLTISEETYQILVNFSTINSSIVFKKGNLIRTIANAENILGEYVSEAVSYTHLTLPTICSV